MPDPSDRAEAPGPEDASDGPIRALASAADLRNLLQEKACVSKRMSWLLDECVRIPGTRVRFGLDPLLGLVPYGGETVATLFGALILADAGKKGLPLATLVRMGGNMILNAAVGAIPLAGDLFSFWFKSNTRNYRLLDAFLESEYGHEARGGWWPVLLVVAVVVVVLALNLLSWIVFAALLAAAWGALLGAAA